MGAQERDVSVDLSGKPNRKELATYWFRWKEKSVWSFWLREKGAVYSGALCGGCGGGDRGHLVPIRVAGKKITEVIVVSLTRMEVES